MAALGWIALFLVLVIVGHRFHATIPPLEGDVLGLATAGVLIFHHVLPLVFSRFENADPSRHPILTTVLSLTALALWSRAELLPRFLPKLPAVPIWDPAAWENVMLPLASCIGTAAAATAMWVAFPSAWVAVAWLGLVIALGFAADWIASTPLALQADAFAIAALAALAGWDLGYRDWHHRTPALIAIALLYCGMRRKTFAGRNLSAAYSWASAILLLILTFDIFHDPWLAPVLVALCLALFEIGRFFKKGFFRWQGYLLIAAAFAVYLNHDLPYSIFGMSGQLAPQEFTLVGSALLEVLILIAGGYWLLERTTDLTRIPKTEHIVGLLADAAGTFSLMVWFGVRLPFYVHNGEGWVTAIWAAMATVLMALAWIMRRRTFMLQAIALAVAAVLRGLLFDLGNGESHGDFWHGTLYRLSIAALILMAALPFAFKLRGREFWTGASIDLPEPILATLSKPEQWFFFAPFAMMVISLAVKLSSGHITIAWSLLGLGTFLFALIVGERSFRLAGLGLLLVSVAKILLMDVWALAPPDRYVTLIVLGTALLSVSFLYTRFSEKIRKFL